MNLNLLIYILSILSLQSGFSQTRVSSIFKHNQEYATYRDQSWYRDTLFVSGVSGYKAALAKFSKEGELFEINFLSDTSNNFRLSYWDKGLLIQDSFVFHSASKSYATNRHHGVALKLSHANSELKTMEFSSIYNVQDSFIRIRDFKPIEDGFIFLAIERRNLKDIQSCLLVTDHDFNLKWRKCYGSNTTIEIPNEVWPLSNGNFIVISSSSNLDISEQYCGTCNGYYKGYIFEVNHEGQLLWEWKSPDNIEASYSGYLENDSTLIIASGHGVENCSGQQSNDVCFHTWTGGAYKFDLKQREKIWSSSLSGGPFSSQFDNRYYDIIQSIEKDGYILCGSGYTLSYEGCQQIDTTEKCWAYPGVIAKISNEGDSMWLRKYFGVTDIWESNFLASAIIAPDTGYSFVGEAFNPWPGSDQGQFGWLLMTDNYGCLVPGCELISSTDNGNRGLSILDVPFKVFPNPATDLINILITKTIEDQSFIVLFDRFGSEIDRWNNFELGGTYMIPSVKYSPGVYFITLFEKGKVTKTEKLIILN